jgi:hypothetical protein
METWITLFAALVGLTGAVLAVVSEVMRRRSKEQKVIVQVVYPPELQKIKASAEVVPAATEAVPVAPMTPAQRDKPSATPMREAKHPQNATATSPENTVTPAKQAPQHDNKLPPTRPKPLPAAEKDFPMEEGEEKIATKIRIAKLGEEFNIAPRDIEALVKNIPETWGKKYAVVIQDKHYPPKEVIAELMKTRDVSITKQDFTTNEAIQILKKLGFKIVEKAPELLPKKDIQPTIATEAAPSGKAASVALPSSAPVSTLPQDSIRPSRPRIRRQEGLGDAFAMDKQPVTNSADTPQPLVSLGEQPSQKPASSTSRCQPLGNVFAADKSEATPVEVEKVEKPDSTSSAEEKGTQPPSSKNNQRQAVSQLFLDD